MTKSARIHFACLFSSVRDMQDILRMQQKVTATIYKIRRGSEFPCGSHAHPSSFMFERGFSYKTLWFPFFLTAPLSQFTIPIIKDFHFIFALPLIFHLILIPSLLLLSSHKKKKKKTEEREKSLTKLCKCLFMNWASRDESFIMKEKWTFCPCDLVMEMCYFKKS